MTPQTLDQEMDNLIQSCDNLIEALEKIPSPKELTDQDFEAEINF